MWRTFILAKSLNAGDCICKCCWWCRVCWFFDVYYTRGRYMTFKLLFKHALFLCVQHQKEQFRNNTDRSEWIFFINSSTAFVSIIFKINYEYLSILKFRQWKHFVDKRIISLSNYAETALSLDKWSNKRADSSNVKFSL